MDFAIGAAMWFAARGQGTLWQPQGPDKDAESTVTVAAAPVEAEQGSNSASEVGVQKGLGDHEGLNEFADVLCFWWGVGVSTMSQSVAERQVTFTNQSHPAILSEGML